MNIKVPLPWEGSCSCLSLNKHVFFSFVFCIIIKVVAFEIHIFQLVSLCYMLNYSIHDFNKFVMNFNSWENFHCKVCSSDRCWVLSKCHCREVQELEDV